MPRFEGQWQEMPKDTDELEEKILHGFNAGYDMGRDQGRKEMAEAIEDFVKVKYFNKDVVRGTKQAEDILELAAELADKIRNGGFTFEKK